MQTTTAYVAENGELFKNKDDTAAENLRQLQRRINGNNGMTLSHSDRQFLVSNRAEVIRILQECDN